MQMPEIPEAVYDSLSIVRALTPTAGGATLAEVTLFAYLACLLSIYDDHAASDWGYTFAATKTIAPFSDALSETLDTSQRSGMVVETDGGFALTRAGEEEIDFIGELSRFNARDSYLAAACNSTLAVPLPRVGSAVAEEPVLRQALALSSTVNFSRMGERVPFINILQRLPRQYLIMQTCLLRR